MKVAYHCFLYLTQGGAWQITYHFLDACQAHLLHTRGQPAEPAARSAALFRRAERRLATGGLNTARVPSFHTAWNLSPMRPSACIPQRYVGAFFPSQP
jgi:hypothetical protein